MYPLTTPAVTSAVDHDVVMPLQLVLRAYAMETRNEALRVLRTPGLSVPFLLLPVPIYLFFGTILPAGEIAKNPALGSYLFCSWCVYAAMGPAMFGAGCTLAAEREAGVFRLRRALPSPPGAWLVAKTVVSMAFTALAVVSIGIAARIVGATPLSLGKMLIIGLTMVAGAPAFCALGLFVGARASGSSAPAIINVVFLPMLWLSGLFFPLPGFLEKLVVIWPAFHLNQVAIGLAGVAGFSYVPPAISAAVLAGVAVLFGGLAIRRLASHG
jgi:ABC-2 type transport system permease protein